MAFKNPKLAGGSNQRALKNHLHLEEALIALSISATTSHTAELAMKKLSELRGCDMHMTHIPTPGDEVGLKHLGINLTTDEKFSSRNLFVV